MVNFEGRTIRKAPKSSKGKCIERAVTPMMSYRCSIWHPQKQVASELDAMQRKMISIACPIRRDPGEDSEQHARRKGRYASKLVKEAGTWSGYWFRRALAWDEHVHRNRSGCNWNHYLLAFHDMAWIQDQRFVFARVSSTRINRGLSLQAVQGREQHLERYSQGGQEAVRKCRDGCL